MTSGGHSVPSNNDPALFLPNDYYAEVLDGYYGEDLDSFYWDESMPKPALEGLQEPEHYGYPKVVDYWANEFGEYFDNSGMFMGSVEDFVEMGYLSNKQLDQFAMSWCKLHLDK